jgi:hypothetical protein
MELDELKSAWQTLGRQVERHNVLQSQLIKQAKLDRARGSLRPLLWAQALQALFGLGFILLASLLWIRGTELPAHVIAAGAFVHAYGVVTLALAGATMGRIRRIDYAAPVLAIQKSLAGLRRLFLVNGRITGLSWWVLLAPVLMTLAALGGLDLYAHRPRFIWLNLALGVVGLLATWAFHRWSRRPERAALGARLERAEAGASLRRSQSFLDEIAEFERG